LNDDVFTNCPIGIVGSEDISTSSHLQLLRIYGQSLSTPLLEGLLYDHLSEGIDQNELEGFTPIKPVDVYGNWP